MAVGPCLGGTGGDEQQLHHHVLIPPAPAKDRLQYFTQALVSRRGHRHPLDSGAAARPRTAAAARAGAAARQGRRRAAGLVGRGGVPDPDQPQPYQRRRSRATARPVSGARSAAHLSAPAGPLRPRQGLVGRLRRHAVVRLRQPHPAGGRLAGAALLRRPGAARPPAIPRLRPGDHPRHLGGAGTGGGRPPRAGLPPPPRRPRRRPAAPTVTAVCSHRRIGPAPPRARRRRRTGRDDPPRSARAPARPPRSPPRHPPHTAPHPPPPPPSPPAPSPSWTPAPAAHPTSSTWKTRPGSSSSTPKPR